MPRIRTIKPEFWTDTKIVELLFEARLLFIGLWNFCDDEGFLEFEPLRLKMQIFPNDDLKIALLIDSLQENNLITIFSHENKSYIYIHNFLIHQRISHPVESKIKPLFRNIPEDSGKFQSPLECSALKGKERKGKERKYISCEKTHDPTNKFVDEEGNSIKFYYEKIPSYFNQFLSMCPKVMSLTDQRKQMIKIRQREEFKCLRNWLLYFMWISESDFLTGSVEQPNRDKSFVIDFDWIMKPTNLVKIMEGKYHEEFVKHGQKIRSYYDYQDCINNHDKIGEQTNEV